MKPFLGTDITNDKHNEQVNGQEFLVEELPESACHNLEKAAEEAVEIILDSRLPLILRIIEWLTGLAAFALIMGTIKAMLGEDPITFAQIIENAPFMLWAMGGCTIVWLVLFVASILKSREVLGSDESEFTFSKLNAVAENNYKALGVPSHAETVEILAVTYKLKDGVVVPKERGFEISPFDNLEMRAYVEDGHLMIADCGSKYAFPLEDLRVIETVNKRITIPDWFKDEEPNKGYYKQFKLRGDGDEGVSLKPYHILQLRHNGVLWGIYFPCYELEAFERLTGLKAM